MAKDKDRALNPAAAQRKADKTRALKKSKAEHTKQRNEKLARRNPERLQRQIDDLAAQRDASGGQLRPRDKAQLEQLERDVTAIRKARDASGFVPERREEGGGRGRQGGRGGVASAAVGKKRRRDEDSDTDESVRAIPMPRDTPPPVPRQARKASGGGGGGGGGPLATGANLTEQQGGLPVRLPPAEPITTYEAAPQIRDLRKEATVKFVPAAVAAKLRATKGTVVGGRLLEPEEADRLESEGYYDAGRAAEEVGEEQRHEVLAAEEARFFREVVETEDGDDAGRLELRSAAQEDATEAAEAAGEEERHEMLAGEVPGTEGEDGAREHLRAAANRDAEQLASAATEETTFRMMAQRDAVDDAGRAETQLRHVEMEEVSDEDV